VDSSSQVDWPIILASASRLEPHDLGQLVADFAFPHNQGEGENSVNNVWDGSNINSDNVSKRVANKMKRIASCIGVAISGHENENAQLVSRIENQNSAAKQSSLKTAPVWR